MIKRIFILLLFIFTCCTDQLLEKTTPLDGIYYVLDGWEKFEEEDYVRAHDLFSTVLLNNNTQYFGDAYVGLAWNSIYAANTMQGVSNSSDREYQRDISNQYFSFAHEYVNSDNECIAPECSVLCQNLLAGQTYNSSYQALESSRNFYDYGLDSLDWKSMEAYSDSTIFFSNQLFNECNGIYVFDHDTTINYNSIRILRAQTYVRIAEFDNAELELLEVDDLLCESKNLSALECLDKISNYGYACTDGDGTIGMANDNNPSGAPPCNFNSEAVLSDNKKCIYADIGGSCP